MDIVKIACDVLIAVFEPGVVFYGNLDLQG